MQNLPLCCEVGRLRPAQALVLPAFSELTGACVYTVGGIRAVLVEAPACSCTPGRDRLAFELAGLRLGPLASAWGV